MNLEHLRYFLGLARYGKLTVAAERMGVEHTTIRRRIGALEKELNCRLFDKTPRGWILTSKGRTLLPEAEQIESRAQAIAGVMTGTSHRVKGTVRIVATDGFGAAVIAPGLKRVQERHPDLELELVTTSQLLTYGVGEFDIAVTIHRPQRSDLNVEHLCAYDLRLYASRSYLENHPTILEPEDLAEHELVWFVSSLLDLPELKSAEDVVSQTKVGFRTTNLFAQLEAATAGVGLGVLPSFLAHEDPRLMPVLHEKVRARRNFWIITPTNLSYTERIAVVVEHLRSIVRAVDHRLVPGPEQGPIDRQAPNTVKVPD